MAYLTVTTHIDVVALGDGQLSLREAVTQANATEDADVITFAASLEGQRLVLTGGQLIVSQDLIVDGNTRSQDAGVRSMVMAAAACWRQPVPVLG